MTALTATERGDLVERLLPAAARFVCLVHGDGGPRDIQQALARLESEELAALPVLLAALVPPDAPVAELLQFVTWDEHGAPAAPVRIVGSVRELAACTDTLPDRQKRAAAIVEDTAELAAQGLTRARIAERLGVSWDAVTQAHSRSARRVPELAA